MKHFVLLSCLLAWLTGCAMNRLPNLDIKVMEASGQLDKSSSSTPQAMIAQAEADLKKATGEELDYYAPMHLSMAETHLKKAQNLLVSGGDSAGAVTEAAFARKVIEKGLMVKQTVLRQLDDVFAMKDRLDTIKAEVYFRDEYKDQLDHITKLIQYIEKDDMDAVAKKKSGYLGEMRTLEVNVVKKKTLTEPMEFLAKARDLDAKALAPKTLKAAEDTLAQSTVFIESYPRDDAGVDKAGLEALRACQHVFFVTKEVIIVKNTDKNEYETLVLDFENNLHRITQSLGETDVRYMSLHDQSVLLSNKAEELKRNAAAASISAAPSPAAVEEKPAPAPVALEAQPVQTVTVSEESTLDDGIETMEQATEEPVDTQTVSDSGKTGEDSAYEELEAETTDVAQEEPAATPSEENASTPEDDTPAPVAAPAAKVDKSEEPLVDNPWDGSAETFNMDVLYLSDEERARKKNKTK